MSKRPFVGTVICFVLGMAWRIFEMWQFPAVCFFLIGIWQAAGWRYKYTRRVRYLLVWFVLEVAAFFLGNFHALRQLEYREAYLPYIREGAEASLQGVICKKEEKNEEYHVYLKEVIVQIDHQRYRTNQVLVHLSTDEYPIGTTLYVNGTLQRFRRAANEGGYDEEQYYHARKVDYGLRAREVKGCYGSGNAIAEWLYQLRKKLRESLRINAKEESAGILAVMTLGEKSMLDTEIKEQYKQAGISHILVISGLHISLLGLGAFRLLRKWFRVETAAVAAICLLLGYGCMTGSGTSTMRAIFMFILSMGGTCLGRTYDSATGLAAAACFLLWQNPFLLTDAGFLFSVTAVLGVIFAEKEAKAWKVSASIQLFTLPLAAYYYYEIPVYALIVNLLVLPLVAPVTVMGLVGGVLGLFWQKGAKLLLLLPHVCLQLIGMAGNLTNRLPFSRWISGCPALWQICGYYLMLAVLWKMRHVRKNPPQTQTEKEGQLSKKRIRLRQSGFGILIGGMVLFLTLRLPHPTRIDVLDVGQGDGICIQTREGVTLFIDGGSSDTKQVGIYRIEPYLKYNGIDRIDYWFVSHSDTDHISGLLELIERGYKIEHLVVSACEMKNENQKTLRAAAKEQGIEVHEMKAGDTLQLRRAKMRCLFPASDYHAEDVNATSLVLLYEEGNFQGLFTGDTGSVQERELFRKIEKEGWDCSNVDFYKAAHHGSKYSNSQEWLAYLRPKVSLVSCGKNNSYGHPAGEAVAHMQEVGSDVWYTMEGGQVNIFLEDTRMKVQNYQHTLEEKRYPVVE